MLPSPHHALAQHHTLEYISYGIKAYYYKDYTCQQRYPLAALRDFIKQGLLLPSDRIAFLGAINGTGATFLEVNSVQAILDYGN